MAAESIDEIIKDDTKNLMKHDKTNTLELHVRQKWQTCYGN